MGSVTREAAIQTLEDGQLRIAALVAQLNDEELTRPAAIGGGDWSAKDLMGHVARWNEIALEALAAWRQGEKPWIEGDWTGGVDKLNAENYERSRDDPLEHTRGRFEQSHAALVAAIREMSNEEWHSRAPYPTERRRWLGILLGGITGAPKKAFGHAFAHLPDLEAYVAATTPGRETQRT